MKRLILFGLFLAGISTSIFAGPNLIQPDYNLGAAAARSYQPATAYYQGEREAQSIRQQQLANQRLALEIQQERLQLERERQEQNNSERPRDLLADTDN